jgi:hypothetical protein
MKGMRFAMFLALPVLCSAQAPQDLRALVRDSLRFLDPGNNKTSEYSYRFVVDRKQYDSAGAVKSHEIAVGNRSFQDGVPVSRLVEKNGKKLSEEELRKQEEAIRTQVAKEKALTAEEREKRLRKAAENDGWMKEIPDALEYKYTGEESIDGRPAYLLLFSPRPGYSANNVRARLFEKTNGKLWIDKADRELVKGEAETFAPMNIGFGLVGKIEKGTRFSLQRRRLAEGAWLLDNQMVRFAARIALFKYMSNEVVTRQSEYRHKSLVVSP